MPTNTEGVAAREHPLQFLHYLRKTVNFNDVGIDTGIPFSKYLPLGASIQWCMVKIKTVFNAGSTNVLTVGTVGTAYNNIVAAADVDEAVAQANMVLRGADLTIAAAVLPYIKYTQTGGAATTGQAEVEIVYACNNDE